MRFLIDVSAGSAVAEYLQGLGHDVLAVKDLAPHASDDAILAWSVREDRIVVTDDKDFGDLVFRDCLPHAGVLLLRPDIPSAANRRRLVERALRHYGESLAYRFTVATERRLRQHDVPRTR